MRLQKVFILIIIFVSVGLAYYVNRQLQRIIAPRRSFGRLASYIFLSLALAFLYAFLVVFIISKLFPLPKR